LNLVNERRFISNVSGVSDTILPDTALGVTILVANIGTGSIIVRPVSTQTIDGVQSQSLGSGEVALFVSDGSSWRMLKGATASGLPAHHTTHEKGGTDEMDLSNMLGLLLTPQTPIVHSINGAFHSFPGGAAVFLNGDGAFVAAGGAGASATRTVVTAAFPAKRNQRVNVVDAAVGSTSKVNAWVSGIADGSANAGDLVDIHVMRAIAKVGSFDLDMDFMTPWAGSLSIDYVVFA
jgi:hypothetical protein